MAEFILEGVEHAARKESAFVLGFIEAMFFTNLDTSYTSEEWNTLEARTRREEVPLDGCLPSDVGYTDIHPDSLAAIRAFCEEKQKAMRDLLEQAYERGYSEEQAGRDLWYTVGGHGVGYWDRTELDADGLGDKLTEACGRKDICPFFGEHVTYGDAPFVHVDGLQ